MTFLEKLSWFIVMAAIAMIVFLMFIVGLDLHNIPTIYKSATTGECVKVFAPRGVYSCDNLPIKFYLEWVQ